MGKLLKLVDLPDGCACVPISLSVCVCVHKAYPRLHLCKRIRRQAIDNVGK